MSRRALAASAWIAALIAAAASPPAAARQAEGRSGGVVPIQSPESASPNLHRAYREAQSLAMRGAFAEALARLDLLGEEGRDHRDIILLRGNCLRKLGRPLDAVPVYRHGAATMEARGEDPIPMLIELERAQREGKDPQAAFGTCLEIHRRAAHSVAWIRDEMESLIQADLLGEQALEMLRRELERRPEAADLRDLYVHALFSLGRYEASLREAIVLDRMRKAGGRVLLERLRILDAKGFGDHAVAAADAVIAEGLTGKELQEALYLRAGALRRLRRHPEAIADYQRAAAAMERGPLARTAMKARAETLVRDLGDLERGAAALEELIASLEGSSPADRARHLPDARVALADCRLRMGQFDEAASILARVESETGDVASRGEAAFQQAEILFYAGRLEDARTGFDRVVREYAGGARVNDALDRLLLLLRNEETDPKALATLGTIAYQWRADAPARVLAIVEEARAACGECPAAEDLLREEGRALIALGRIDDASQRADTLAARFQDSPAAPALLRAVADAMRMQEGFSDRVQKRYEDLLTRFPRSHEAFEVRTLLQDLRRQSQEIERGRERGIG